MSKVDTRLYSRLHAPAWLRMICLKTAVSYANSGRFAWRAGYTSIDKYAPRRIAVSPFCPLKHLLAFHYVLVHDCPSVPLLVTSHSHQLSACGELLYIPEWLSMRTFGKNT